MAPRTLQVAFQPLFALMAVGLLLAAIVAVGVGSRGNDDTVVPPSASVPPSSGPSVVPSEPAEKLLPLLDQYRGVAEKIG